MANNADKKALLVPTFAECINMDEAKIQVKFRFEAKLMLTFAAWFAWYIFALNLLSFAYFQLLLVFLIVFRFRKKKKIRFAQGKRNFVGSPADASLTQLKIG